MAPLLFFFAGVPAAFVVGRLIDAISSRYDELPEDEEQEGSMRVRRLPWQRGRWPGRVRLALAVSVPFLMAAAAARFDAPQAVAVSLLVCAFLVCTGTDLLRHIVPNVITYPAILFALLAAAVSPDGEPASAIAAASVFGLVTLLFYLFARGGFGLGDVKLAVLIGASLGLAGGYVALVAGVMAAGLGIAVLWLLGVVSRRHAVPYAPFLALAAVVVIIVQGAAFAPL